MILALDLGNSRLSAGWFVGGAAPERTEMATADLSTEAALVAAWRKQVRRVGGPRAKVGEVVLASVVPAREELVSAAAARISGRPVRRLIAGVAGAIEIGYDHPTELGADRLAAAWGARARFPGQDVIVVDCGTATTVTALVAGRKLVSGAILAGWGTSLAALADRTGRLPKVLPERPESIVGRGTVAALQAGAWYGQIGALREILAVFQAEAFSGRRARVLATGGHAPALAAAGLFDEVQPHLVLEGLRAWLIESRSGETD